MNAEKTFARAEKQSQAQDYEAALKTLDKLKRYAPSFRKTYVLECFVWEKLNNPLRQFVAAEKARLMYDLYKPEDRRQAVLILMFLADALESLGQNEEALEKIQLALKYSVSEKFSLNFLAKGMFVGNCIENFPAEDFRKFYDEYQKILSNIKPYPRKFYDHEKIRIGFLSSDLYKHPVVDWSLSLLTKLDKNFFATYFYSNNKVNDEITEQLRAGADGWHDIKNLSDEVAASLIRDDEIDILFDLNGHTNGNRLPVAAYHPASVQMSGIGYENSTGLDCFDYFLSDENCAGDENFFTEKLIKLPHSHICYALPTKLEPADYPPCLKNNFVTFGSFNQLKKITASMLAAWKAILDAVPDSRLLLKNKIFNTDNGKIFFGERLRNLGFNLIRVELRGFSNNHHADYNDLDIALDTFPYTGVTTTAEALYMGVPVVSLYGQRNSSRLGLNILNNVGLYELAVDSYEEYVKRAVALANDWELLTILRRNLRTMMKKSPLMNSELYVSEMQDAFVKILNEQKNLWMEKNFLEGSR